ncbi:MAG: hypothetical protein WCR67_04015 [Bacilli bacterium]
MAFEFHHLDKWAFSNLDLSEETMESQHKAVILISGASSSGKSYAARYLKELFNQNGHKALILSLDKYNFGLSGIIPNKVNLNYFNNSLPNMEEIESKIKKIIYDVPFDSKYKPEILEKIRASIKDLINPELMNTFIDGLSAEWKKLNFDEPTVYNLQEASQDIIKLLNNEKVSEKRYSKVICERLESTYAFDGHKYDVIIAEGIYALDESFLSCLKTVSFIKNFIDGNPKSLFLRRIIRDSKITSADNVFTVNLYFKYIVKSYKETIAPCRLKADVILNNNMSFTELRAGALYRTKDEIFTSDQELINRIKGKSEIVSVQYQEDYYLVNEDDTQLDKNNIIRFRQVSADEGKTYLPSSLIHKGAPKSRFDNKVIRPINILLSEEEFTKVWPDKDSCLSDFINSGFKIGKIEKKRKTRLIFHNQKITLREIENKGTYIEFSSTCDEKEVAEIKKLIC